MMNYTSTKLKKICYQKDSSKIMKRLATNWKYLKIKYSAHDMKTTHMNTPQAQ